MSHLSIISEVASTPRDGALYLIQELTKQSGFFALDGKLLYVAQDMSNGKSENVTTEFLSLKLHVSICAVQNNPSFISGFYDFIELRENSDVHNIESFVKLCCAHAQTGNELSFRAFFYSLIDLFQLPREQQFKNALGLYGELKLIEYIWSEYGRDISLHWHKSGSFSRHDFAFDPFAIEVKSIISESLVVPIKHHQLFGFDQTYLCVLNCESNDMGETISLVTRRLRDDAQYCNGLNFAVNLEKELKRISFIDFAETKFNLRTVNIYKATDINPFTSVPDEISKLSYSLDLVGKDALLNMQIGEMLKNV